MMKESLRQRILRKAYPLLMRLGWLNNRHASVLHNEKHVPPPISFYSLSTTLINGKHLSMESFRGKKILLVNTASDCGYTAQFSELQEVQKRFAGMLVIIGFPANDFKAQEKGNNEAIAEFCTINFGVTFPLAKKSSVIKGSDQNEVFDWLTNEQKNGWNNRAPVWNFCKYLVNEQGVLMHCFGPSISPVGTVVIEAIKD